MKDFFDCYQILMTRQLDSDSLYDAIKATFNNRGLEYNPDLKLFTDEFASDPSRVQRWKAFMKKIQWKEQLDFDTVIGMLREHLQPHLDRYWQEKK